MVETLDALVGHLGRQGGPAKVVVWAQNSHLGDARATEMSQRGELNEGQLMREKYGRDAVLVGFTTHHGTVTAASDWGGAAERKRAVQPCPAAAKHCFIPRSPLAFCWPGIRTALSGMRCAIRGSSGRSE
jgi:erythromycin esterase-like protein